MRSELAVTQYRPSFGRLFVLLRYHDVYGSRMGFSHVIPQICERILRGQRPLVVYSARHRRAFCYISDAVEATIPAVRSALRNDDLLGRGAASDRAEDGQ